MPIKSYLAGVPEPDDVWRALVLYGKNVASYKFALAKSLLELRPRSGQTIRLEELAVPYSRHIVEHLKICDRQMQGDGSSDGPFLEACKKFQAGGMKDDELIARTKEHGFNLVLDKFHNVDHGDVRNTQHSCGFFNLKGQNHRDGIVITDDFSRLSKTGHFESLMKEAEGRWRLVETAWKLRLSPELLSIESDEIGKEIWPVIGGRRRRVPPIHTRGVLNGYQKGKCFYCYRMIIVADVDVADPFLSPDVDHFFPYKLRQSEERFTASVNGVWNLVLACRNCNRGPNGKFDHLASPNMLHRLTARNWWFIFSHHPLREPLIRQFGGNTEDRVVRFHHERYEEARRALGALELWDDPSQQGDPTFE